MSKSIILTGAGKGLGYSLTKLHLELGDSVWALEYAITPALKALMKAYPTTLTVCECDVGNTDNVRTALKERVAAKTCVDIVYCIAGIHLIDDEVSIEQTNWDDAMKMFNINAAGPMRVLSEACPLLKRGTVVMVVTSEAGSIGDCHRSKEYGYCMSKAAANMGVMLFTNAKRGQGVRTFCVHPGWLKTDMSGEAAAKSNLAITAEQSAEALSSIALHPEEIPEDVIYLDYKRKPIPW